MKVFFFFLFIDFVRLRLRTSDVTEFQPWAEPEMKEKKIVKN